MYKIYADGELLYAPHLFNEGCGVISPKLSLGVNKSGSLDFTMTPNSNLYDSIKKLKSVITVTRNDKEIFRGRALYHDTDYYKQKKVYCEGDLAYLLDSIQPPRTTTENIDGLFRSLIDRHNERVEDFKRFTVGRVTLTADEDADVESTSTNYINTFDAITQLIIDPFGGQLVTRMENGIKYIDLLDNSADNVDASTVTQRIEFGVNLLDITENITAENIFTVILPLGGEITDEKDPNHGQKITITGTTPARDGDYIEDADAIAMFGRIEKAVEFSEIETANNANRKKLKKLGQKALDDNLEVSLSLTVRAVDLNFLNVNYELITLGDWVRVISLPHGIDSLYQCTNITYDMENPENNEYSFGRTGTSFTEQQVANNKNIKKSTSTVLVVPDDGEIETN